jgi:DNA-binding SARP family transcriptional activator/predicted ATPase
MTTRPDLIRIYLLGRFEVARSGVLIKAHEWPRRKAAALLQRLAYERRLVKDQAIDFLWPESAAASGANNLYRGLHVLRQALDASLGLGTAGEVFSFEDGILRLKDDVWVDAREFERACRVQPGESPGQRRARLEQALDLYKGDFLPDERYEEWVLVPRESLSRLHREASLSLASAYQEASDYPAAIDLLSPLLSKDPADEPVHRELMRAYARTGRRHDALRQYEDCVEALHADLGVAPSPETVALYGQILSGELGPPPVPVEPLEAGPTELPPEKPRPLFVGRERELAILGSHLEAALAEEGRVVFITGEAGQGKTSLMAEFAYRAQAEHPELVVAAGACQALAGIADPYLPFRELVAMLSGDWQRPWLGGHISAAHARRLQAIAPQTTQAIAAHAPDLAGILAPAFGGQGRGETENQRLNQRQIFEQMRQLLRILARRQPLLLLLDDLQWSDSASANLLFHLGRQLASSAVLILGAYRPSEVTVPDMARDAALSAARGAARGAAREAARSFGDPDSLHPLAPVVQELVRYLGDIRVDLGEPAPAEGRSFVDALLDSEPNRLDSSFREAMYRRTRGHPLFAVELLRALQEQGDLVKDEAGMWAAVPGLDWDIMPARVEAVIARRIDRLPGELRNLLEVASVEGESFTAEVLAKVQAIEIRPLLQQLSGDLERRYRLVREQGEVKLGGRSLTRYQFQHNLFQQYLYQQLGEAERRLFHGEIAAVLEQICGDELAVSLSSHYLAAGDVQRAVPYLCRAGDEARRRLALKEAIQFYQSALEHWPAGWPAFRSTERPGEGTGQAMALTRVEVLHRLGETLLALGRTPQAIERFSETSRLYEQAGDRPGMGAMQRLIGRSYWEQGERAKSMSHYQRALTILEGEPESAELARATGAIAQMHMLVDDYDQAIAWGERALALARSLDTEDVVLHVMVTVGISSVSKGDAERGLAMLRESQERAERLGLPHDTCRAYTGLGDCLMSLGRYAEARSVYECLLDYARKARMEMFEGVALAQSGYLEWWSGNWRTALEREHVIRDWMALSDVPYVSKIWASNLLGEMYTDLGLPEAARAALDGYTAAARSANEPQTTAIHLGQLSRLAREESERAGLVREMLALVDASPYTRYDTLPALRLACAWLVQTSGGDPAAYSRLEKAYEQMRDHQAAAALHEVKALAAGIRGEWRQTISDYQVAAVHWESMGRPYDLLRVVAGWLQALASTGDDAGLAAVRQKAQSVIEKLSEELVDPEMKKSFLASPLVMAIRER